MRLRLLKDDLGESIPLSDSRDDDRFNLDNLDGIGTAVLALLAEAMLVLTKLLVDPNSSLDVGRGANESNEEAFCSRS